MIRGTIESIDDLIRLKRRQIKLLEELRANLAIAERAGVDPNAIARVGYDQSKDLRWNKWPPYMKATIQPEWNYVVLKDGTRVDVPIDWRGPLDEEKRKRGEKAIALREQRGY
jgi:hypothetical protein